MANAETAATGPSTRAAILVEARRRFALRGYEGTSLNEIAEAVGIKRPSLLYYFPNKEALYQEVFQVALAEWIAQVDLVVSPDNPEREPWKLVDDVLKAGFGFFQKNPEFVTMVKRTALDQGSDNHLGIDLGVALRPLFRRAVDHFGREMDDGTYRRFDPELVMLTGYGALLSYFSDWPLTEGLLDRDPLSDEAVSAYRQHFIAFFRAALEP